MEESGRGQTRQYPGVCVEGMRKTKSKPEDSQSPGLNDVDVRCVVWCHTTDMCKLY
jgi:hypothetical protein